MTITNPGHLLRRPSLLAGELPASYICRLAWANGFSSAGEFCRITKLQANALVTMASDTADTVSMWGSIDKSELRKFAMPTETIITYGDTAVKRTQLQTTGIRYCPECLKRDSTPYIRGAWHWRMIGRCTEHGCLLELDRRGASHSSSFAEFAYDGSTHAPRNLLTADTYFMGRLHGAKSNDFLDQFAAYALAEMCTLIGHLEHGVRTETSKDRIAAGFENPELRQRGFEIVSCGRQSMWDFLSEYVSATSKRVKSRGDFLAAVLYWSKVNKHNPEYQPLFRLFQEHAEENLPFEPGEAFIWPITKRKVHTVATASREYGVSEERVRRTVEKAYHGTAPRFMKRDDIHAAMLEATSYRTTSEAANTFGCSMAVCDGLIKEGLLSVAPNRDYEGRVYRLVHKTEIEAFIAKLEKCIDRNLSVDGLVSVTDIFRTAKIRVVEIVKLAFEGRITHIAHVGGAADMAGLYFDPEEIIAASKNDEMTFSDPVIFEEELIDMQAAWRRMGVKKSTLEELVHSQVIPTEIATFRGAPRTLLKTTVVDEFSSKHVTLAEIASAKSTDVSTVFKELTDLGFHPVADIRRKADMFFKKSEAELVEIN
jgi:hypothetical protein